MYQLNYAPKQQEFIPVPHVISVQNVDLIIFVNLTYITLIPLFSSGSREWCNWKWRKNINFKDSTVLARTTGYMDHVMKEAVKSILEPGYQHISMKHSHQQTAIRNHGRKS